eukprot:8301578-Pyramimonas_sp.AAC.1
MVSNASSARGWKGHTGPSHPGTPLAVVYMIAQAASAVRAATSQRVFVACRIGKLSRTPTWPAFPAGAWRCP